MKNNSEILATATGVGQFEYILIDIRTIKGMDTAERLKRQGWKIISVGFTSLQFERKKSK